MGIIVAIIASMILGTCGTTVAGITITNEPAVECNEELAEIEAWFSQVVYEDFGIEPDFLNFYWTDDLNYETLTTRNERGEIIVERIVGRVLDDDMNGVVLTTEDEYFNYISYRNVNLDLEAGDYVVTYLLYDTDNNYEDCFNRYDYPISSW